MPGYSPDMYTEMNKAASTGSNPYNSPNYAGSSPPNFNPSQVLFSDTLLNVLALLDPAPFLVTHSKNSLIIKKV